VELFQFSPLETVVYKGNYGYLPFAFPFENEKKFPVGFFPIRLLTIYFSQNTCEKATLLFSNGHKTFHPAILKGVHWILS
jgi:hypothetical protein